MENETMESTEIMENDSLDIEQDEISDILNPEEIPEEILETIIESLIETSPETLSQLETLGEYDNFPASPLYIPDKYYESESVYYVDGNAKQFLDAVEAERGYLVAADFVQAQYLQLREISIQLTSVIVLIISVIALLLIGDAVRR